MQFQFDRPSKVTENVLVTAMSAGYSHLPRSSMLARGWTIRCIDEIWTFSCRDGVQQCSSTHPATSDCQRSGEQAKHRPAMHNFGDLRRYRKRDISTIAVTLP